MTGDPVRQSQLLLARLVRPGPTPGTRLDDMDEQQREQVFAVGAGQVASLSERLKAQTGFEAAGARVLDYGCGVGRTAVAFAQSAEHVYGLDISQSVLAEAARYAEHANLTNVEWMDAGRLGELAGQYDLVVSFYVLQHIPSREGERIFETLVRGLRPRGAGAIHIALRPSHPTASRNYLYRLMHTYSLDRIGRILGDLGVMEWHARFHPKPKGQVHEDVTLIFRKD